MKISDLNHQSLWIKSNQVWTQSNDGKKTSHRLQVVQTFAIFQIWTQKKVRSEFSKLWVSGPNWVVQIWNTQIDTVSDNLNQLFRSEPPWPSSQVMLLCYVLLTNQDGKSHDAWWCPHKHKAKATFNFMIHRYIFVFVRFYFLFFLSLTSLPSCVLCLVNFEVKVKVKQKQTQLPTSNFQLAVSISKVKIQLRTWHAWYFA